MGPSNPRPLIGRAGAFPCLPQDSSRPAGILNPPLLPTTMTATTTATPTPHHPNHDTQKDAAPNTILDSGFHRRDESGPRKFAPSSFCNVGVVHYQAWQCLGGGWAFLSPPRQDDAESWAWLVSRPCLIFKPKVSEEPSWVLGLGIDLYQGQGCADSMANKTEKLFVQVTDLVKHYPALQCAVFALLSHCLFRHRASIPKLNGFGVADAPKCLDPHLSANGVVPLV
ncbi:hypothetical protein NEUTE1DRAFT_110552 [Neurospora tetrasperma FGSC 2508]|uniref:Uncharacterized protein n=1 Tax=Neurospora tetrasperma (strain FGSC 2508 / ATCC MYA-4615 / P0657) TaxID=510951 RepID=F8MLM6_NEUT8|nr:uncharacterized protein NEUTE1DRAFT_110552 [Neurospora tetrasperma FGSC 2508]EGO58445.1 hypothetical protein NEUTE1DRAFT_110552 [Neurospora tetrasperma FGSC 2508]EGZ71220.1 hypothetical protein NEUTE2DRAFT_65392 [Neurospora tetrasperma FGSC 2509]